MSDPDDQAILPPVEDLYGTDAGGGLDPAALDGMLAVATDPETPDPGVDPGLDGLADSDDVDLADLGEPADAGDPGEPDDVDGTGDDELDLPSLDDEVAPLDDGYPDDGADPDDFASHGDPGDLHDPLADL